MHYYKGTRETEWSFYLGKKRTTINDIAKVTGYSVTTISLVLNNKAFKIPESTKKIINAAVQELDYRPNQIAVGLVKRRTNTIGLIISDISNLFFATLAKGAEDASRESGFNMILCNTEDDSRRDFDYINILADKGVDGVIYGMSADMDFQKGKECCELLEQFNLPFVLVDRYFDDLRHPSVVADNVMGGYLATTHLIELGHKRIACVTGPSQLSDSNARLDGYRKALSDAGISYDRDLIYVGEYSRESGIRAMDWLMGKDFSAIFAFNDMTAYGVYYQASKQGLSIPDNFSLVGYDDILFSEIMEVPLTTVRQPVYEMGMEAARLLCRLLDGEEPVEMYRRYSPTLIVRKSTAPYAS